MVRDDLRRGRTGERPELRSGAHLTKFRSLLATRRADALSITFNIKNEL
jgi:hypothetical protein